MTWTNWIKWFNQAWDPVLNYQVTSLNLQYLDIEVAKKAFKDGISAEDYAKKLIGQRGKKKRGKKKS